MPGNEDRWKDDLTQFARLLCEINATQESLDFNALMGSMDLELKDIDELFERAHKLWEEAKNGQRPEQELERLARERNLAQSYLEEAREKLCSNEALVATARKVVDERNMLKLAHIEMKRRMRALLSYVGTCGVCSRPATYARAMTILCDTCAADPELEWDYNDKESCRLKQAIAVREAIEALDGDP